MARIIGDKALNARLTRLFAAGLPKGDLVSTGVTSERRNQAETFASAAYADALEFGTHKMAPRPAMKPAFDETKERVMHDIATALRGHNRG